MDMARYVMMGAEVTTNDEGKKTRDAHDTRQVGAREDRTTALIKEHVHTRDEIQNGVELKEDQAASDSEQEDMFDEDEDDMSVEAAIDEDDRNI